MHGFSRLALMSVSFGTALAIAACGQASSPRSITSADQSGDATPSADAGPDSAAATTDAGMTADASNEESCYGLFHWLQKDAYKSTGGRTDPAWPPHTTTVLEVHCVDADGNDVIVASAFRDNHGTDPGTLDTNGNPMLTEVKVSDPAPGTRDELLALLAAYSQCECAPATQFLSMTDAEGPLEQQILAGVTSYVQANLVCSGATTTSSLVSMLESGDFDDAIAALPDCTWTTGADWQDGLDQAAESVFASLDSTLASYHVCNNDAMLEAQQWTVFATTGAVQACDNTTPLCQGPAWYYAP
jgi:hypothetical protein